MREYVESGLAIDVILAIVALEAVVLALWRRRLGHGSPLPLDVLGNLLAGGMMLLAVRAALTGADYQLVALFLTLSLPAHLVALLKRPGGPTG